MIHYFFLVCIFFVGPLNGLTPRLLIVLGDQCDFTAEKLAKRMEASIVDGSEENMRAQILRIDQLDGTHLMILDSPVGNLPDFAAKLFYDYICLNEKWSLALKTLKIKIEATPKTDADFKSISSEDRGRFYSLMMKVSAILNKHSIPFWGISGTLLGAVRHRGMIPWDDDLDIIIRLEDKERFENLAQILEENGLQLYIYHHYFYKIFPKDGVEVSQNDGTVWPWKYPFIDVFVVNNLNDKICIVSHDYPLIDLYPAQGDYKGWYLYPRELQLPAMHLPFGPLQLPVPHNAEAILTREYGQDWEVAAYMWYDHAHEEAYRRIKVRITNYSPPEYILPWD